MRSEQSLKLQIGLVFKFVAMVMSFECRVTQNERSLMPQISNHSDWCLQGLGELYEEEFVTATTAGASTAVDKQDAVRQEAKNLMKELFGKLDALSHFHYAPKPVIEEMQVRADVPALAMEEVAPQVGCTALAVLAVHAAVPVLHGLSGFAESVQFLSCTTCPSLLRRCSSFGQSEFC